MPAFTKGSPVARFMRRGIAKVSWLPTVAAYPAGNGVPTAIEVGNGTVLEGRLADMSGWMLTSSKIDTPDMGSRFTANIPGEQVVADSSLTFYGDDGNTDALKTTMAVETSGFIYIRHSGAGTGKPADLFPVRVMSIGNEYSVGNDPARYTISYAITGVPALDRAQA